MSLPRWSRSVLKLLLGLALLWQMVVAPVAATAGCCDGEQACCVALRAGAGCVTCVPVMADTAMALAPSPALVDRSPASLIPQTWLSKDPHDIWRPPMAVV